jgi:hypothetical protein
MQKKDCTVKKLPILLLVAGLLNTSVLFAKPVSQGFVSFTEKPMKLIRDTGLYTIVAGTRLQPGDMLESGASMTQIEGFHDGILALGPNSRIYLDRSGSVVHIHLLQGWLKVQPAPGVVRDRLLVETRTLRLDTSQSSSVIHATRKLVEVFVEEGSQTVTEIDKRGQPGRKLTLTHEQFSQRKDDASLELIGSPTPEFVSEMPNAFYDPLVRSSVKRGVEVVPQKIRDVEFKDIAPWLQVPGLKRSVLASRFSPRLANSGFRTAITREMGGSLEWEVELLRHEQSARISKASASSAVRSATKAPSQ